MSVMDATSQISQETRDAIIDNVQIGLGQIDIGLNQQRALQNARANFVCSTYDEIDNMSIEQLRTYAKNFRNGWQDLIIHEEKVMGSVCVNGQGEYFHVIFNLHIHFYLYML